MANTSLLTLLYILPILTLTLTQTQTRTQVQAQSELILTIVNNCPFTIWPAIQPNSGSIVLEKGGFALSTLTHRSFRAPNTHWSGRIWARTDCTYSNGRFSCATGDCGGRLECHGLGGATPATLAQFSLHHGHKDQSSYEVSLVDGFNLPMTVTPHEGKGLCPVVGCKPNLLQTCPEPLKVRGGGGGYGGHGPVLACKSGCEAFNTDALCCRNHYNNPQNCRESEFSRFFKHACPATFTYAHDSPSLIHDCSSPHLCKNPVDGFSAGLANENNLFEWSVTIIGPPDTLYEGGFFNAIMTFPQNYPNSPPSVRFTSDIWHPNVYQDGRVCISILHPPGDDPNGYELASERWSPVHTVESIMLSIISMLSGPNDESPANVEAAKEWREDKDGFRKKVSRCVRKSQEML
ncbi:hypothetical protein KSS87_016244 [Heliosperma pusillum]|nr:hypothetical protein KSS87_016244 [Heliosperma pusillum]